MMQYLLLASTIWAFSYGLIKTQLLGLDPNFVTACRMTCALLCFLPFLAIKSTSVKLKFQCMAIGAVQYGLMYLCFIRAFQYCDAHLIALYTMMTPVYVILIHQIIQQNWKARPMLLALCAVVGGIVVYFQSIHGISGLKGFFMVQHADILFALGQVCYKNLRKNHTELDDKQLFGWLLLGALGIAVMATSASSGWHDIQNLSIQSVCTLVYLGTISSGVCFFWWNKGAVLTETTSLAIMNNLKGPLAVWVSIVFFQEQANLYQLQIGLMILLACLLLSKIPHLRS